MQRKSLAMTVAEPTGTSTEEGESVDAQRGSAEDDVPVPDGGTSAAGTVTSAWQAGHFSVRPASFSLACKARLHEGHDKEIRHKIFKKGKTFAEHGNKKTL